MAPVNPDLKEWKQALGIACASGEDDKVRSLLGKQDIDQKTRDAGLQLAIQSVISSRTGKESTALLLLREFKAATLLPGDALGSLLHRAVDNNDVEVVQELLRSGAESQIEYRDKKTLHRTPFFSASLKGNFTLMQVLLDAGANINTKAGKGQTVLIYFAAEKGPEKQRSLTIVEWLVKKNADLSEKDSDQKNVLHWAADSGKIEVVKILLAAKPDVEATSDRGRTALHFAAAGDCPNDAIIDLLLKAGAEPMKRSDGGWTALHNAAQNGNLKAFERLLRENVDINAELSSRVTPLHWAAGNGHEDIVKCILEKEHSHKHRKDVFGSTPMIRAAQNGHISIAKLFHPCYHPPSLASNQRSVCNSSAFRATIVDFEKAQDQGPPSSRVKRVTMFDLLYSEKAKVRNKSHSSASKNSFRWIHLPANNMAWAETLFNKLFLEEDAADVDSFKLLQKTLSHQHRGRHVHSTFMIPQCSHIRPISSTLPWLPKKDGTGAISEQPDTLAPSPESAIVTPTPSPKPKIQKGSKPRVQIEREAARAKSRRTKMRRQSTTFTGGSLRQDSISEGPNDDSENDPARDFTENETSSQHGNIALFMPYLHFETHERRVLMTETIKSVKNGASSPQASEAAKRFPEDVMLVRAYLDSSPSLHPRRTLDQFLYHSFDTENRDSDQVVYRYYKNILGRPPKIYMVDQLWLWIWGEDLIVTCFPQRWGQSQLKNDPLCVLDGVIEDINSKTRPPVRSVHDLAMLITGRCSGGFDRHRLNDQNYMFLDIFDSSIGDLSVKEPILFERFEKSSSAAAKWLREQEDHLVTEKGVSLNFVNDLLDIEEETTLLKELKDIRDELNIILMIFGHQKKVLRQFEEAVCDEQHEDTTEAERRFREQRRLTELHMDDVKRMDSQAQAIFTSLTQLLDFKQKHANAVEARFAREQATATAEQARLTQQQARLTARQGETIMVFTIVTIFFLPMSFIAAFGEQTVLLILYQRTDPLPEDRKSMFSETRFGVLRYC
jgi:ankyrin repeat protein/Mg2+ and Co2+ transporter CorA